VLLRRGKEILDEMTAGKAARTGDEDNLRGVVHAAWFPLFSSCSWSLLVLAVVVGLESWILFFNRAPPPFVVAIPFDRATEAVVERLSRRPAQTAQLGSVEAVASIVPKPIGHWFDQ
jgi:hypothetical protein